VIFGEKAETFLPIAASSTVAAIAATPTASATTTVAATASTTAATAAAAAEPTTATATTPGLALTGFVDGERAAVEWLAMQLGDSALCIFLTCELDESEASRLTGHTIGHDADADDFAPTGGACLTK
jgi:hypothetical protein